VESQLNRVRRVALTGGIATGKSHVRTRLEQLGVPTVDADILAREAVAQGSAGFAAVIDRFGSGIVAPDGSLDRRALGAIVFSDPVARRDLESIIHPQVRETIDRWFTSIDPMRHPFAVADIPLLFESGRDKDFDAIILTNCSATTQLQRLLSREGMTETEARHRIASQLPVEQKLPRATFVIDTDGTFENTDAQVEKVVAALARRPEG
jgi:dephospho-CoA kinase